MKLIKLYLAIICLQEHWAQHDTHKSGKRHPILKNVFFLNLILQDGMVRHFVWGTVNLLQLNLESSILILTMCKCKTFEGSHVASHFLVDSHIYTLQH